MSFLSQHFHDGMVFLQPIKEHFQFINKCRSTFGFASYESKKENTTVFIYTMASVALASDDRYDLPLEELIKKRIKQ